MLSKRGRKKQEKERRKGHPPESAKEGFASASKKIKSENN